MAALGSGSLRSVLLRRNQKTRDNSVTMHHPHIRADFVAMGPVQAGWPCARKGPTHGFKLLPSSWNSPYTSNKGSRSAFRTEPCELCNRFCFLLSFKTQPFGRWDCFLPLPVEDLSFVSPEACMIIRALSKKKIYRIMNIKVGLKW